MDRPGLARLRLHVLHLHKAVIDDARIAVERSEGRLTPHQFLDRLMHDPALAWVKPLSTLIIAMDEWIDEPEADAAIGSQLAAELRRLLVPDDAGDPFQQRYGELLQRNPDIVLAHARAVGALGPADDGSG